MLSVALLLDALRIVSNSLMMLDDLHCFIAVVDSIRAVDPKGMTQSLILAV